MPSALLPFAFSFSHPTMPQVFINNKHRGAYKETYDFPTMPQLFINNKYHISTPQAHLQAPTQHTDRPKNKQKHGISKIFP